MTRSIASILLPIVMWGLLWFGANYAVQGLMPDRFDDVGVTNDPGLLAGFIGVSVALSILAGFACARLAPRLRMRHVLILGLIQLGIGIVVQVGVWDDVPLWFHVTFLGFVVPAHLAGGWLGRGGRADAG